MTTLTTHYNLILYDNLSPDVDTTFDVYRGDVNGTGAGSNMNLIDAALYALQVAINKIPRALYYMVAAATGSNTYEDNSTYITTYYPGLTILLAVDTTNTGSSTLNVNSLGVITLYKYSSGTPVTLSAGDLTAGVIYPFVYTVDNKWVLLAGQGTGGGGPATMDVLAIQVFS